MKKTILIFLIVIFINIPNVIAIEETEFSTSDIIEEQMSDLNLGDFITKSKEYSGEFMEDTDIGDLLESAISGKIDNNTFFKKILKISGKEVKDTIKILGSIIIIIVIHSVLKSISESLENKSVATITYYVQYILIVTLIMTNFTDIIEMIRESIKNMVGFSQILIPLLMTLLLTTGNITSAGAIEPIILFLINVISNSFEIFIIPIVLISTAISIVSKISDKIQIDKLSKFIKSRNELGLVFRAFIILIKLSRDGKTSPFSILLSADWSISASSHSFSCVNFCFFRRFFIRIPINSFSVFIIKFKSVSVSF